MSNLNVIVERRTVEAEGICSFVLSHPTGDDLPFFTAGAHVDVHVKSGVIRQYSLSNDPVQRKQYRIAVLLEPQSRGGSAAMHSQLAVGQVVTISAPRNHFPLVPASRSLLIAGGIGITPLLSMAKTLHSKGADFELHYCGRTKSRMAFIDELLNSPFSNNVHLHFDDGAPAQRFDAQNILSAPKSDVHMYVCGPSGFMNHVLDSARQIGWDEQNLHREFFTAAPLDTSEDGLFKVRLARTGKTCDIPADKSVMDVLLAEGVDVSFSCESGVCGTCLTPVLEGIPDHRDSFLTDAERALNDQFTPCCSRAKTAILVLDL
jgi:vanillate O-demethylase ferredoxin subunit